MSARQRRRNVRSVDVYPVGESSVEREFTDGCRSVAELYSLSLAQSEEPIKATVSWVRIFVDRRVRPGAPSRIEDEPPDNFGFSDGLRCAVDPAVLSAPASERPRGYLDWLHARMLELARARGWDEAVLHRAYQDCLDAELTIILSSKPKSSPDRRHRAVLEMRIDPDGTGRVALTVRNRTGDDVGRTTSLAGCEVADFRVMARQITWDGPTQVTADDDRRTLGIPGLQRISATVGEFIDIDSTRDPGPFLEHAARFFEEHGLPQPDPTPVHDQFDDSDDEDFEPDILPLRRIYLIGGGPVCAPYGIDEEWSSAFCALLGGLDQDPAWRSWWESAGEPECVMEYETDKPVRRVRIRRLSSRVAVSMQRPKETLDARAEGREDAEAVIQALRHRFGLAEPPPFPSS